MQYKSMLQKKKEKELQYKSEKYTDNNFFLNLIPREK